MCKRRICRINVSGTCRSCLCFSATVVRVTNEVNVPDTDANADEHVDVDVDENELI